MEIAVTIVKEDFEAFLANVTAHFKKAAKAPTWVFVLVFVVVLGSLLGGDFIDLPTLFGTLAFVWLVAWLLIRAHGVQMLPAEDGWALGPARLFLDEDGIHETREHGEQHLHWGAVRALRETEDHFFLMIDDIAGLIVPKRDLPGDDVGRLRMLITDYARV